LYTVVSSNLSLLKRELFFIHREMLAEKRDNKRI